MLKTWRWQRAISRHIRREASKVRRHDWKAIQRDLERFHQGLEAEESTEVEEAAINLYHKDFPGIIEDLVEIVHNVFQDEYLHYKKIKELIEALLRQEGGQAVYDAAKTELDEIVAEIRRMLGEILNELQRLEQGGKPAVVTLATVDDETAREQEIQGFATRTNAFEGRVISILKRLRGEISGPITKDEQTEFLRAVGELHKWITKQDKQIGLLVLYDLVDIYELEQEAAKLEGQAHGAEGYPKGSFDRMHEKITELLDGVKRDINALMGEERRLISVGERVLV